MEPPMPSKYEFKVTWEHGNSPSSGKLGVLLSFCVSDRLIGVVVVSLIMSNASAPLRKLDVSKLAWLPSVATMVFVKLAMSSSERWMAESPESMRDAFSKSWSESSRMRSWSFSSLDMRTGSCLISIG